MQNTADTGTAGGSEQQQPLLGAEPIPAPHGQDKPAAPSGEAAAAAAIAKAQPPIKLTAARLRMDPANETMGTARKLLTRVAPLPKPDPQWYVQIHPDPEFRI